MNIPSSTSLKGRAVAALALLVGFYVLAFGVAGVLGLLAFDRLQNGRSPWVAIIAATTIYAVIKGVFFIERREADPAGLRIDSRSEPRLVAFIRELAEETSTHPPDEIFLVPDVNAFVFEQGRFLGLVHSKRVMGIGVALLNLLNVDELRAVIAHEFGHYVAGDTRLTGIVYRARSSIERTIAHLRVDWIAALFSAYGKLFMRVTQGISRRQELDADALAASVAGRAAQESALKKVVGGSGSFDMFMRDHVVPLWQEGHYPDDLYSGFRSFLLDPVIRHLSETYLLEVREVENPYDSHPSLDRRLAAIAELPAGSEELNDDVPARDLLGHPDSTEREMSEKVAELAGAKQRLTPVPWHETGAIFATRMRAAADRFVDALGVEGLDIQGDRLPRVVVVLEREDAIRIVRKLIPIQDIPPDGLDRIVHDALVHYISAVMMTDLVDRHGYRLLRPSWSNPYVLSDRDGRPTDVGERVRNALATKNLRTLLLTR